MAVLEEFFLHRRAIAPEAFNGSLSEPDRDLARELVFGVLRHRARLDAEVARFLRFPLSQLKRPLREILETAIFQIRHLDRIPPRAAVHEAVELARTRCGEGGAKLANGVLRSLLREAPLVFAGEDAAALATEFSHPEFLVGRWLNRFGLEKTRALLASDNRRAGVDLLFDPRRICAEELATQLKEGGVESEALPLSPGGLRVISGNPLRSPLFARGLFYIADAGSQILPRLLPPGDTLLDLTGAPGGKSLAALFSGWFKRAICVDRSLARVTMIEENRRRLQPGALVMAAADARMPPLLPSSFSRVLLDAPCSGTGTLRKNPEIRYRLTPEAIRSLAATQEKLLSAAAELVAPGGFLLYSTCSLEEEENGTVVTSFLARRTDFDAALIEPSAEIAGLVSGNRFRIFPDEGADGFTAHLLKRER